VAKFKYKFETIKGIKQNLEKKTKKELAVIDLEISKKTIEIQELSILLKEQKRKKIDRQTKTVREYHFDEKYESFIVEKIGIIQKYLTGKKNERKKKLEELIKNSKETKIFEKLEEKHLTDFIKSQEKSEQKEMDEFAVNGFLKEN
jgi:flagellar export protein FliJ